MSKGKDSPGDNAHIDINDAIAILEVARNLALSYNIDDLLRLIIDETVRVLDCERASIFLYDPHKGELYSKIATGADEIRVPIDCGIVGACVRTGKIINVPDAYADPRFHKEVDQLLGYRTKTILSCPLVGLDGRLVGVLQAINKKGGPFDKADEWAVETLASQAAVALQRAMLLEEYAEKQRLERELDLAREIQQSFLPRESPDISGYDIAGWNRPAEKTGGDCFDFIYREGSNCEIDHLGLLLADASGHGIAPALIASQLRAIIRSLFGFNISISSILDHTNRILCRDLPSNRFITAFYGLLFPQEGLVRYCSAGQGPIIYLDSKGNAEVRSATCCPLGILEDTVFYEDKPIRLQKGDFLILITDGFFEARNSTGEQFGVDRIIELFRENMDLSVSALIEKLVSAVEEFAGSDLQSDDLTCIIIKRL